MQTVLLNYLIPACSPENINLFDNVIETGELKLAKSTIQLNKSQKYAILRKLFACKSLNDQQMMAEIEKEAQNGYCDTDEAEKHKCMS